MANSHLRNSGLYGGTEAHLSYEAIEVERERLLELAAAMETGEIRRAAARLADFLQKHGSEISHARRAELELRGRIALEVLEAANEGKFRFSRAKRLKKTVILGGNDDVFVRSFSGLSRDEIPLREGG